MSFTKRLFNTIINTLNNIINLPTTTIMAPKNVVKNLACVTLGLFFVSLSSFLMTQIYFQNQIDSQIQNVSILKDLRFPTWGKNPNPTGSLFSQTFTLFNLDQIDNQIIATKSNITKRYEYRYQYQNTSFAQGNSGRLNFINKWELKEITGNAPSSTNIKTINLAADKVFNYDFYAPPQRKFPIIYNYLVETLTTSFLQKFYVTYLHKFFFQYKDLVLDTVFKPLGFQPMRATQIYSHESLGWQNVQNFKSWVVLSLKGYNQAVKTQYYETLMTELGLTSKQIQSLVFQKSTINNMISALNGTIKSKLMMPGAANFNYKCSDTSCTNAQLVSFQMASSFLTSDPLFASLNLNMSSKDLNTTFLADIEYQRFCDRNKGKFVCMSKSNMVKFFTHNYLGDFEKMDMLWRNKNNFDFIKKQFDLENNTAQSVVSYVLYLYEGLVSKYENDFAWAQTNFNNIQPIVMTYRNLLLVELYSRAFFNKFFDKKEVKCSDYFVGQFADFAPVFCQSSSWNFIKDMDSLKKIMQANLFIGGMRDKLYLESKMNYEQIIAFFNNEEASLFAKQLKQIESIFKVSFGCINNGLGLCTSEQLFCMQWGSGSIFNNLPLDIFSNKIKSILEWDTLNVLNGLNPDYHSIIGKEKTVDECLQILSSDTKKGIFNIFNILRRSKQNTEQSNDILKYIGRNVMQVGFKGILNTQDVDALFKGFKSSIINKKNELNISSGGAPWLENQMKLVKTDNKIEIKNNELLLVPQFDTIDTGIYNQDKTRQITKIWGQTTSSSKYTVYRGTKTDDEGTQIPVDIFYKYVTDRKVEGTNMLGFQPNIETGENLKVFVNQAHQAVTLNFQTEMSYEDRDQLKDPINAYKYSITLSGKTPSFIGIEELNQNYFQLSPESYVVVEPMTGLTLELSLTYNVKSSPLYSKFILDSTSPIQLYSSELFYKRKGLEDIQQLISYSSDKHVFGIVSIIAASISLALTIGLVFVYCKLRKGKDQIEQSLMENNPDIPTPNSVYTS